MDKGSANTLSWIDCNLSLDLRWLQTTAGARVYDSSLENEGLPASARLFPRSSRLVVLLGIMADLWNGKMI